MEKPVDGKSIVGNRIVVCVSGMAGTGKSTLCRKLAQKYGLRYYSGGDALKELAAEDGYTISGPGWWESSGGLNFLEKRGKDGKFDKAVDDKLLENARQGNVLLDSWTMPWLLPYGFKIWLSASVDKRAERIVKRDKITFKEALEVMKEREGKTKAIYQRFYGFALGEDFTPFHLVMDTDNLKADEVFSVLCKVLDNLVFSNKEL